jgi:predicted nuclease of predicted toxin-antitoxin system
MDDNLECTLLTFDRDYGELIFRYQYKPEKGVIYLRLDKYQPQEPGLIIEDNCKH